jgi:hypothetical protein
MRPRGRIPAPRHGRRPGFRGTSASFNPRVDPAINPRSTPGPMIYVVTLGILEAMTTTDYLISIGG